MKKICIVCSCGGHLAEVRRLRRIYERYDHLYILNDTIELPADMEGKTWFVAKAERNAIVLLNVVQAFRLLVKHKPDLILSTGAGIAVPFALIGRMLSIPVVFIETFTRIERPSLTGRLMYRLATRFFYQWQTLRPFFPSGTCCGPLI